MNRIAIASFLLVATCGYAYAGGTAAPAEDAPAATVRADSTVDSRKDENVVISSDVAKPRVVADTGCVRESGTRIRRPVDANGCNGLPGASYARGDLNATGRADTASALKSLDTRL